jgi:hypothetical protein
MEVSELNNNQFFCLQIILNKHLGCLQIIHSNIMCNFCRLKKLNSVAWVRERTIPTERPPLVGEVSVNFFRIQSAAWSAWRIPPAVISVSRPEPLLSLPSSSSIVLTRLSGPRSRPTTFQRRESKPDLWICSQELWPLDHRGVYFLLRNIYKFSLYLTGIALHLLWGTNWIYICYVEENIPLLWSRGQSSWLHNGDVLCFLWVRTEFIYVM